MKHLPKISLGLLVVGISLFVWVQAAAAEIGNLHLYQGSTEVVRGRSTKIGATGEAIKVNDIIRTKPDSRTAIILKDGSVIRLDAGTEVKVAQLAYAGRTLKEARFQVRFGRLWSRTAPLQKGAQFEVETPTAVAAVAGTSFNTTYQPEQLSGYYVYRHQVKVRLKEQSPAAVSVNPGQLLRMHDSSLVADFQAGPKPVEPAFIDEWIRFNQAEDDKLDGITGDSPSVSPSPEPPPSPASPSPTPSVKGAATSRPRTNKIQPAIPVKPAASPNQVTPSLTSSHSPSPAPPVNSPAPASSPSPSGLPSSQPSNPPSSPSPVQSPKPSPTPSPPAATKKALRLVISHQNDCKLGQAQFIVTVYYDDSSTEMTTNAESWSVSPANEAKISTSGLYVSGPNRGSNTVTASHKGLKASQAIDITKECS